LNVKAAILGTIQEILAVASEGTRKTHNLLNNYLAMLLRALFQCDLYTALTELAVDETLATPARILLKTVSKVAANLMPDFQQFPTLLSGSHTEELVADMDTAARLQRERAVVNLVSNACEFVCLESTST
jgi:signal transduction histidine kinase